MMPELIAAATRTGRECGCPAYVIRCAHVDGDPRVVWLLDGPLMDRLHPPSLYTDKEAYFTGWCPCRPLIATTFSGVATVKVFTNAKGTTTVCDQCGKTGLEKGMFLGFTVWAELPTGMEG